MDFDFRSPDYDAVIRGRIDALSRIRTTSGMLEGLKGFYKTNPGKFISDWGMTSDPRNAEIGLSVDVPFVLFPKQSEFIDWLHDRWQGREDGVCEKSRDMGVSWLCVGFACWMWLFHPGTVVGFGSRKEEYVDKIGDPKSLFWKARKFIESLPPEFRPEKWDGPHMRLLNEDNGASIVGEAGDNIGRGNRTGVYFVDEAAFLEHADAVDAALSQTSNCKVHVSTPNGPGNAFARKRRAGKIPVFTFHWRDDPRKDEAWYKRQCEILDPVIVAQEIDINYEASQTDAFMDGHKIAAAQRISPADIDTFGPWIVGVDAAHFGDDESILHFRRGRLNLPQVRRHGISGVQLAGVVTHECRMLEKAGDRIHSIVIELDGPGVSCYDQLRLGRYADKVFGVHTGAKLKDDVNYNVRSRIWGEARDYLNDEPVSLPPDGTLAAQLGAMKYLFKNGLRLMQSKKEYKKDNGCSPDRADAFVLTFAAPAVSAGVQSFEPGLPVFESMGSFEPEYL